MNYHHERFRKLLKLLKLFFYNRQDFGTALARQSSSSSQLFRGLNLLSAQSLHSNTATSACSQLSPTSACGLVVSNGFCLLPRGFKCFLAFGNPTKHSAPSFLEYHTKEPPAMNSITLNMHVNPSSMSVLLPLS